MAVDGKNKAISNILQEHDWSWRPSTTCSQPRDNPHILHPAHTKAAMISPRIHKSSTTTAEVLHHPQPRRLKRALLEEADHLTTTSKRVCCNRISHWLETVATSPLQPSRSRSTGFERETVKTSTRPRSAPVPTKSSNPCYPNPNTTLPKPLPFQQLFQSTYSVDYVGSVSTRASSVASKVDDHYRSYNLEGNSVYMHTTLDPLPDDLNPLIDMVRAKRSSPAPDLKSWEHDPGLIALETGKAESDVDRYFRKHVFPEAKGNVVRSDKLLTAKHAVPRNIYSPYRISQPVPDILYGYQRDAFTHPQRVQLTTMGQEVVANATGLLYPFLLVEMKADGPHGGGSLWVATNQCLGGSAACTKLISDLNDRLSCSGRGCSVLGIVPGVQDLVNRTGMPVGLGAYDSFRLCVNAA